MRLEIAAFEAALAGNGFGIQVGDVPSTAIRYVLLLPTFSPDLQERLTGPSAPQQIGIVTHCYAATFTESVWLADKVDSILRPRGWGVTLDVPGRDCDPVERSAAYGPARDPDDPTLWDSIAEYQFISRPK